VQQARQQASQEVAQAEKEAQTKEAEMNSQIQRQAFQKTENQKTVQRVKEEMTRTRNIDKFLVIMVCSCFAVFLLGLLMRKFTKRKCAPASGMDYNENLQSLEKGLLNDKNSKEPVKSTEPVQEVESGLFSWDITELCKSKSFEAGEPITGISFIANGVPDLRLKFYPAGDLRAPNDSCTLFLEIPCGWQISARLFVGDFTGTCQGEMPYAGPGATWGLRGDCPRPGQFTTVGVELLSAIDIKDQLSGA
jgi:hypothetical protein